MYNSVVFSYFFLDLKFFHVFFLNLQHLNPKFVMTVCKSIRYFEKKKVVLKVTTRSMSMYETMSV